MDRRGSYERRFLLHEEDLKNKFKKWMRKNLRKLTVDFAWEYLNTANKCFIGCLTTI